MELLREDLFTDLTVICDKKEFRLHKIMMAAHSDYFYRLLTSGMREVVENRVKFPSISSGTFDVIVDFVYNGCLRPLEDVATLCDVLGTSNMLQMEDLEYELLLALADMLTPHNCLQIKSAVDQIVNVGLGSRDWSKRDDVVCVITSYLEDCLRDRWNDVIKSNGFLDLDVDSLCYVLEHRASHEEIGDFTFSFVQGDLVNGIVGWLVHDLDSRHKHLQERLSDFYCLHQVRSETRKTIEELTRRIETRYNNSAASQTLHAADLPCKGRLCPKRMLTGLLVVHAWTPHEHNFITSDHVKYSFVCPPTEEASYVTPWKGSDVGDEDDRSVRKGALFRLKEFGELCEGEQHLLVPNSMMPVESSRLFMSMTAADDKYSGLIMDGVGNKINCLDHHSIIYHFCPTNFPECKCNENHWTFCSNAETGTIWGVTSCPSVVQEYEYDPCCRTFRKVKAPEDLATAGAMAVTVGKASIVWFGGYRGDQGGNRLSVVMPTQDLLDREGYKGGHAVVSTVVQVYNSKPKLNSNIWKFFDEENSWKLLADNVPDDFGAVDAATVAIDNSIYVVGGSRLETDTERGLHYYKPISTVMILNLDTMSWSRGPSLPGLSTAEPRSGGFSRGTAYVMGNNEGILFSGGVGLRVNPTSFNQIYQYVTNTKVFYLPLNKVGEGSQVWHEVLDLSSFKTSKEPDYCVFGVLPSDLSLTRIKIHRGQFLIDQ